MTMALVAKKSKWITIASLPLVAVSVNISMAVSEAVMQLAAGVEGGGAVAGRDEVAGHKSLPLPRCPRRPCPGGQLISPNHGLSLCLPLNSEFLSRR
jgi:hypothetical protein